MDIARNLLYQKNNFKNIYKTYFNEGLQEAAISEVNNEIDVEGTKFITIVVDEYYPILTELFYIEDSLEDLEDYIVVSIEKEFLDSYEVKQGDDTLFIKCIHPYMLKNNSIRIIKKLNKKYSDDNSLIIISKELSSIENRIINNKRHKVIEVKSTEEENSLKKIKNILMNFKSYYNEKIFIESKLVYKDNQVSDTSLIDDSFRISIAMDLINTLSTDGLEEEKIYEFLSKIKIKAKLDYEKVSKKIVDKYLNDNFTNNYLVIDKLLSSIDIVEKGLYDYFINNFSARLEKIIKIHGKSERYVALMDSGILKIDVFLSDEIKKLSQELSSIA